jgi:signal transduction histidine kinase
MTRLVQLVIAASLLAHIALLVYGYVRREYGRRSDVDPLYSRSLFLRFVGVILTSGIAGLLYLLPTITTNSTWLNRGLFLIVDLILVMAFFGALILHDLLEEARLRLTRQRWTIRWIAFCALWLGLFLITTIASGSALITQPDWLTLLNQGLDLPTIIALSGFAISGITLLVAGFRLFYQSPLPELANRTLYWVLVTALMIASLVLLGTGSERFAAVGMLMLTLTNAAAVYALTNHRVFDLRGELSRSFSLIALTLLTAGLLFGALYMATSFELETGTTTAAQGIALLAVIAIVIALVYVAARQALDVILRRTIDPPALEPSVVAREFSQRISQVTNVNELAKTATAALNDAMKLRRSGLLLVNSTSDDQLELLIISNGNTSAAGSDTKEKIVSIPLKSKLYEALASDHRAVAYYDLIYSPNFDTLPDNARVFFDKLQMSAFAPIVMNDLMTGLLVGGPKRSDTAYTENDLSLITTLAQQTGLALRTARLVADLQHLNATMRSLNRGLEDANQELARLDSVKTDFVTIASHELRTPLAQIRGYTDIIDAVNSEGMLEQEQTSMLVNNLRKATERMEELIAAMLDVSQLDVKAMDLRFTQTSVDTLLRLAIEPLTDAIKQRKQSLMVRGVRGLPTIQADLQRMVQAFRNVIVNAIKFTPDGGRIDITAALQPAQNPNGVDHVLITIIDNGVGIDKAHLELIFKKFYRTFDPQLHSSGTYKFLGAGPGLGLTIAKGVIESHGGRIWAESSHHDIENPPGSTFYILLPTTPPEGIRKSVTFETDLANVKVSSQAT